jgi:hypothetical protein
MRSLAAAAAALAAEDELREPSESSIGDVFAGRLFYPDGVATIMVHGWWGY